MNISSVSYSNNIKINTAFTGTKNINTYVKKAREVNNNLGVAKKAGVVAGISAVIVKILKTVQKNHVPKIVYQQIINGNTVLMYSDGSEKKVNANGQKIYEKLSDGTERYWYDNGNPQKEIVGSSEKRWYENGRPEYERNPDGSYKIWYANGQPKCEMSPDWTINSWYENGQQESERFYNGTEKWWYKNGKPAVDKQKHGTSFGWYEDGTPAAEVSADGIVRKHYYPNGNTYREQLEDGTVKFYYENGKLERIVSPDHSMETWYRTGQQKSKRTEDGTITFWDTEGNLTTEEVAERMHFKLEHELLDKEQLITARSFLSHGRIGGHLLSWK